VLNAADAAAFERFISMQPCLNSQRGSIMKRNSCQAPFSKHTWRYFFLKRKLFLLLIFINFLFERIFWNAHLVFLPLRGFDKHQFRSKYLLNLLCKVVSVYGHETGTNLVCRIDAVSIHYCRRWLPIVSQVGTWRLNQLLRVGEPISYAQVIK